MCVRACALIIPSVPVVVRLQSLWFLSFCSSRMSIYINFFLLWCFVVVICCCCLNVFCCYWGEGVGVEVFGGSGVGQGNSQVLMIRRIYNSRLPQISKMTFRICGAIDRLPPPPPPSPLHYPDVRSTNPFSFTFTSQTNFTARERGAHSESRFPAPSKEECRKPVLGV